MDTVGDAMRTWISTIVIATLATLPMACSDDGGGGGVSTGESRSVRVDPNPVSFATVNIGSDAEQTLTIQHNGDSGTVTLRSIRLEANSDELTITQPEQVDLQPGELTTMTVRYAPIDGSYDSGTIFIDTNVATAGGGALTVQVPVNTTLPSGSLVATPNPVSFGDVPGGTTETKDVTFTNLGADDIEVTGLALEGDDSDFAIDDAPSEMVDGDDGTVFQVGPGGTFEATVSYTPTGRDQDTDFIIVSMDVDGDSEQLQVRVQGNEVGPVLVADPAPVDFGPRGVGETHIMELVLTNAGTRPLEITDVAMAEGSSPTVTLQDVPAFDSPVVIDVEDPEPVTLTVAFDPTEDMEVTGQAIAQIRIDNNDDTTGGSELVDVFGRPEMPILQVSPPDVLDFGFVAQNLSRKKTVVISNVGSGELWIDGINLVEDDSNDTLEYELVEDESWGPLKASPEPGKLGKNESHTVEILFTNEGADTGNERAQLVIASAAAPDGPEWIVDLVARRTGSPDCEIKIVPEQIDFGVVPRGLTKTLTANLQVIGSGNCSFHSAFVNDCSGGFFGASCPDPANVPQQQGVSDHYSFGGYSWGPPLSTPENLKAGETYKVEITFSPPDSAPLFGDEFTDYAGYFGVRVKNPYAGDVTEYYPAPTGQGNSYGANLHARSGIANLTVFPNEVDFGVTTIGCHSQTFTVNACNVGTAPLDLTGAALDDDCSLEFKRKTGPGLPHQMEPSECLEWDLVYAPQDQGGDSCSFNITSNDSDSPSAVVPLEGSGTTETHQVDTWTQLSGQNVDVLFVVDNSGSMGEEQSNLANNFDDFIGEAATWDNDYHLAVTTMDVDADGGRFVYASGNSRITTSSNWQEFIDNVKVGTSGSGTEQGFMAAQQGLSLPNTADSSTSCGQDSDCPDGEGCYDGFCGGPNRGFLRKDASLEIVFVSDEPEQSPADLNFYENFFRSIKGFFNDNLMHIHAIVGPPGGCSSSAGSASAGHRYIDLANATGGNVASICDSNFSTALKSIGQIAFGLKQQFFLSRPADPPSIEVTVAGQPCPANNGGTNNWSYNQPSNSVVFAEEGGCMPQPEEEIVIEYDTICFLE